MADHPLGLDSDSVSRRGFLCAAVVGLGARRVLGNERDEPEPLRLPPGRPSSRVVQVRSDRVVDGIQVRAGILSEMLETALSEVAETSSATAAWRHLLKPDDVIGLKFNSSGQTALGTSDAFAAAVVGSLVSAGWDPKQIVCIEAPRKTADAWGTTVPWEGYQAGETAFASGSDHLARVLDQVTAIVSIPFLKTHNIAGITGALKNLSHALVKHPGRYHAGGCSPFIPDIVAIPAIRFKLRLCLVDGLRAVVDGGPEARPHGIMDSGFVLASVDPVAVDAHAVTILNQLRSERRLGRVARSPEAIPHLRAAHERGLGIAVPHGIDSVPIQVTG